MNRRLALGLAAAAAVPTALRAQSANQPSNAAAPNAATPPANLQGMAPDRLAMMTHEAGAFSLATARIGADKAGNAEVKRFAQFEIVEQEGVAQAMRLAGHNFPTPNFQGEKRDVLNRLQSAAAGDAFDRMFLQAQNDGHQELLNLTGAIMAGNAPAPDKITAILANGQVREHLILIGLMLGTARSPTAAEMPRGGATGTPQAAGAGTPVQR